MTYSFRNDYSEAAHPKVLQALAGLGGPQYEAYGLDNLTRKTQDMLREQMQAPNADIHFLPTGTMTNLTALSWMCRPTGAIISADTGHIDVHEAGAVQATGHKIIALPHENGKLTPDAVKACIDLHSHEHMVTPEVVYVSQSTELGTAYTRAELETLSALCKKEGLAFFIDGARLGAALASPVCDLTLSDLPRLCDAFYIGGTKTGGLFGEALVLTNEQLKHNMRGAIKQRGGLLAKGFSISAQFHALFENDLYFELAAHANAMAKKLSEGLSTQSYPLLMPTETNQIFPILPYSVIKMLEKHYGFYIWSPQDENTAAIRLVTSWATPEEQVDAFLANLKRV